MSNHYELAQDRSGNTVFEPGQNHRKVYVTAGADGLGIADIAAREGMSAGRIDDEWLAANPEYGGSPGLALDEDAGMRLWNHLTDRDALPSSHWLLLERGHDYDDVGRLIARGTRGESADHPVVITAWGSGSDPVIESQVRGFQGTFANVAVTDLDLEAGMLLLEGENVLLENLDFTNRGLNAQEVDGLTLRRSTITEVHYDRPQNGGAIWDPDSKIQGAFIKASDSVLIEDVFADQSGWDDGYAYSGSTSQPQAPSKFSHNFYIQKDVTNLIFRDNVSMRGAEAGAQLRPGGVIEGNVFIANDTAFNVGAGDGPSFVRDNLVTLAGYNDVAYYGGALAWGIDGLAPDITYEGNIVAHHTDPTDAAGRASRTDPGKAFQNRYPPRTDDTIVYNWETDRKPRPDINVPAGVSAAKLEATTVKSFVEDVLGRNGGTDGVAALSAWLRQSWDSPRSEAEMILDYFQSAFRPGSTSAPAPEPSAPEPSAPEPSEPAPPTSEAVAATIGVGRTEAEALALGGGYAVEAMSGASGGAVIRAGGAGTAAGVFEGPAGRYALDVAWLNEDDGAARFRVAVDGTTVDSWTGSGGAGGTGEAETRRIAVELDGGERISLEGTQGGFEYARVDRLTLSPDAAAPAPAPAPAPEPAPAPPAGGTGPAIGIGRIEAESLALSGYEVEAMAGASGGSVIRTGTGGGTAEGVFAGPAGRYVLDVVWLNEDDGAARFRVKVDGVPVDSWSGSGGAGGTGAPETRRIAVELDGGERISLEGTQGGFEYARIDSLALAAAGAPAPTEPAPSEPAPSPAPPPSSGGPSIGVGRTEAEALALGGRYEVEAMGGASGGAVIRADGAGTAAGVFDGPAGRYALDVAWLNEDDGAASFAVKVDGATVDSWTGTGGTGGTGEAETRRIAVELDGGERISLEGTQGGFEYARVDSLTLSAADTFAFADTGDLIA
jgi:hypothetical protein